LQLFRNSKISDFKDSVFYENVVLLNVPVDDIIFIQNLKTSEDIN
jgi:hypothetical protein